MVGRVFAGFVVLALWTGSASAKSGKPAGASDVAGPLLGEIRFGETLESVRAKCSDLTMTDDSAADSFGTVYASRAYACAGGIHRAMGSAPGEVTLVFRNGRLDMVSATSGYAMGNAALAFSAVSATVRVFTDRLGAAKQPLPCTERCDEPSERDGRVTRLQAGFIDVLTANSGMLVFNFRRGSVSGIVSLMAPAANPKREWLVGTVLNVE